MKTLPFITSGISLIILIVSPFIISEKKGINPLKSEDADLSISISDDSKWTLESMESEKTYRLDYIDKDVSIIVDMNESSDDTDGIGISFIVNGDLYSSPSKHLISPIHFNNNHSELEIQVKGEEIRIYTKGGTLGDLVQIDYAKSMKMLALIEIVDQKLHIEMTGLYNISSGLSTDHIICNQENGILSYQNDEDQVVSDVEFLLIPTEHGIPIHLATRATVIKLSPDTHSGMRLDFGKAYSMGGQESVASTLILDEEINSFNLIH